MRATFRSSSWRLRVAASCAVLIGTSAVTALVGDTGGRVASPSSPLISGARAVPSAAVDESSARQLAAQGRNEVLITSKTTGTEEYWAQPDGSVRWRQYLSPVRMNRGGRWVPVDTTLERQAGGAIAPKATSVDLTLSGGGPGSGSRPLVTVGHETAEVGLRWGADLPEPTLDGSTATYAEVLPGVDLKVSADVGGFSEVLVVKTVAAARNPALRRVVFGSHTRNTTVRVAADGRLEVVDASGQVVFVGDASRMWDSSGTASDADRLAGRGAGVRFAAMGTELTAAGVAIVPDQGFLLDGRTRYPVYLDPEYYCSGALWCGKQHHVVVQSGHHDAHNYDATAGDLRDLKAGYETTDSAGISNSYVQMNTAPIIGKIIHWANLNTILLHSWTSAPTPTDLYITNGFDGGTTWDNQPGWGWKQYVSSSNVANANDAPNVVMPFPATSVVGTAASNGWTSLTFLLTGSHQGDTSSWRRFGLNPYLEVNFNSWPNTPSGLTMQHGALGCVKGPNRPWVATRTPQLAGAVSDPDGGGLLGSFGLDEGTADSPVPGTHHGDGVWVGTPGPNQAATAQFFVPAGWVPHDGTYSWLMAAYDSEAWSGETARCEFTVDSTVPLAPTLTATGPAPVRQGDVATFSLKVPMAVSTFFDIDSFIYTTDGSEPSTQGSPRVPVSGRIVGADGSQFALATLSTAAINGNQNIVKVRAMNKAGTPGPNATCAGPWLVTSGASCVFTVLPVVPPTDLVGAWSFDAGWAPAVPDRVASLNPAATPHPLTPSGTAQGGVGYSRGSGWTEPDRGGAKDGTTVGMYLNGGQASTSGPVLDTTRSFTVSAWARLDDTASAHAVVCQEAGTTSGLFLQYDTGTGRWQFGLPSSDGVNPGSVRVDAKQPPQANVWTHVVGTYDATSGAATLYVDGVEQGSAIAHTIVANGPLTVGAVRWNGSLLNRFAGFVDDVQVWQRALSDKDVHDLANASVPRANYGLAEGAAAVLSTGSTGDAATGTYVPAPVPSLQGYWRLDENAGTTAGDASNHGDGLANNSLAIHGGVTWAAGKLGTGWHFDANAGTYASGAAAVDTSRSFTVSAWVKLDDLNGFYAVIGQSGTRIPGLQMRYSPDVHAWIFGLNKADDPTVPAVTQWAYGANTVTEAGQWTLVTGVYNREANQILMYVNGAITGRTTFTGTPWNAEGPLTIGAYQSTGDQLRDVFRGTIDHVQLWQQALTPSQIAGMANRSFVDGTWSADGVRTATVSGTVTPTADPDAAKAQFGGTVRDYLTAARPNGFRTDRSYTVEAWVKNDNLAAGTGSALSVSDADHMPLALNYQPEWGGRWTFIMSHNSQPGRWLVSDTPPVEGRWTHLAGTYDAATGTACLYVNGQLQHSLVDTNNDVVNVGGCATGATGWDNGRDLTIGAGYWSHALVNPWRGGVAAVRVYSGVRGAAEVRQDMVADDPGLLFGVRHF
jgi:Concanavalin A-like lectin/glucanases superfamily